MGGMKDEAKRITIPPLFPRVHVNETETVRGDLSQPIDAKTIMSLYKRSTLSSPTNLSDSPSNLSLYLPHTNRPEKNQFSSICNTSPASKFNQKMNYPSPRGSLVTNTNPSSIKQNEYHFKNLTKLNSLQVPLVKSTETDPQAAGSKDPLSNLPFRQILLSESLEDGSKNQSLNVMRNQSSRRNIDGFNNQTQKKPKTIPLREQDVSDCSAIDSLSCKNASSKDIVKVIGEKRFWKMRTYMINQQKIFSGQVFELHRLIMVQKMVAKSPNLVLESKLNGIKRGTMRSLHLLEMADLKVKKPNIENHKPVTDEYPEHMKPKLPLLPSLSKELTTPIWTQQLLTPPRNHWLVPVMSPLEGLVYKPYIGPYPPPSSAIMVPVNGQDSLDTAFRFPVSPQFSHSYFPPVDHTNRFGQFQRWSNTSSHMTQAIPFSLKKSQESDDSDVHGSTASSPPEKHKLELLPLFPTEPTHQTDEYKQKQQPLLRVIKAIPHNPTSASESAARILRSIQEEKMDSDHIIS